MADWSITSHTFPADLFSGEPFTFDINLYADARGAWIVDRLGVNYQLTLDGLTHYLASGELDLIARVNDKYMFQMHKIFNQPEFIFNYPNVPQETISLTPTFYLVFTYYIQVADARYQEQKAFVIQPATTVNVGKPAFNPAQTVLPGILPIDEDVNITLSWTNPKLPLNPDQKNHYYVVLEDVFEQDPDKRFNEIFIADAGNESGLNFTRSFNLGKPDKLLPSLKATQSYYYLNIYIGYEAIGHVEGTEVIYGEKRLYQRADAAMTGWPVRIVPPHPVIDRNNTTTPVGDILINQAFPITARIVNAGYYGDVYLNCICGEKAVRLQNWRDVEAGAVLSYSETRYLTDDYAGGGLGLCGGCHPDGSCYPDPEGVHTLRFEVGYIDENRIIHQTDAVESQPFNVITTPVAAYNAPASNPPPVQVSVYDYFSVDLYVRNIGIPGTLYIDLESPGFGRRELARWNLGTNQDGAWQSGQIQIDDIAYSIGGDVELEFFLGHIINGQKVDDETVAFTVNVRVPATSLTVITSPVNGVIFLDGNSIGSGYAVVDVIPGSHVISFGDVEGYIAPGDILVNIQEGQQVTKYGNYTESGVPPSGESKFPWLLVLAGATVAGVAVIKK